MKRKQRSEGEVDKEEGRSSLITSAVISRLNCHVHVCMCAQLSTT